MQLSEKKMTVPKHIIDIYKSSKCIYTKQQVEQALDRMAVEIHQLVGQSNPIILCVLIGGIVPTGNLLPRLDFPLELHYVHASRFLGKTVGGDLEWKAFPHAEIKDRTVLVVDDILDKGLTLASIIEQCRELQAKQVYTAVLVDKKCTRLPTGLTKADITGLSVDDEYVFGYGLDYENYLRNAPGIYVTKK